MFPIFFSVSSSDVRFAEQVYATLPSDWTYLYSKTGAEGVHMWDEIAEQELPKAKLLVVFWSEKFVGASGCKRELLQAHELVKAGGLKYLVLRLDNFPITWNDELGEDLKEVFTALYPMLDHRTSSETVSLQKAMDLVQKLAEPLFGSDHPKLPLETIQNSLRTLLQKDRFKSFPAAWISGFNGVGRETLIRDLNRNFTPNGKAIVIDINEASIPRQLLLRLESEAFGASKEKLSRLNARRKETEIDDFIDSIERVYSAGNYVVLRHSRIIEENVELPNWLNDVFNKIPANRRPKLFVISQLPLLSERRNVCRLNLVGQRVPTLDEYTLTEFSYQLIAHFDKNPERWNDAEIAALIRAAGGTIGFLVSLIKSASKIDDFDHIKSLIDADSTSITASLNVYIRWAFSQLRNFDDEQRALIFLNDISPCDTIDLEKILKPERPILHVIGKLIDLGLIERDDESLVRLNPLLARRLNIDLIKPELISWHRNALLEFTQKSLQVEDLEEHTYIKIEARIQAAILNDTNSLPDSLSGFVSAAHWFQAGIRLYHARRREPAYRVLKKAFDKRLEFTDPSRIEIIRYFCLSATQNRNYKESEACIKLLDNVFETKAMASFLRANLFEHKRNFDDAIYHYKLSIDQNRDKSSRMERTYRPLIRCILLSKKPDYRLALKYSTDWIRLNKTVFALSAMARVYLHWKHKGYLFDQAPPDDIDDLCKNSIKSLENDSFSGSSHFEIKAEEADLTGDYDTAISYMNDAISLDPRFELRIARWRFMVRDRTKNQSAAVLRELDVARHRPDFQSNWIPFLPTTAKIYADALQLAGKPLSLVNVFAPQLSSSEIGPIVLRAKKGRASDS